MWYSLSDGLTCECQVDASVSYWDTHHLLHTVSYVWLSRQQTRLSLTAGIRILIAIRIH